MGDVKILAPEKLYELTKTEYRPLVEKGYRIVRKFPWVVSASAGTTSKAQRARVREALRLVIREGFRPMALLTNDPRRYFALAEMSGMVDLALTVKMGVQFSLYGAALYYLGTERHRREFFPSVGTIATPGCFAMTELGHGSNVAALATEATYDAQTDEFDIHTPNESAIKWWIGGAAEDAILAVVFARLLLPAKRTAQQPNSYEDMGVHAFVVPLRDAVTREVLPNVEIRDCGYKCGLNGVDNGAIRFTHARIPRWHLLDRFAQLDRSGVYTCNLSRSERFNATLGALVGGRIGVLSASIGVIKGASTIAVRYAAARVQFGPPNGAASSVSHPNSAGSAPETVSPTAEASSSSHHSSSSSSSSPSTSSSDSSNSSSSSPSEIAILDYASHQQKLMPMVALAYAATAARDHLAERYSRMRSSESSGSAGASSSTGGGSPWTQTSTASTTTTPWSWLERRSKAQFARYYTPSSSGVSGVLDDDDERYMPRFDKATSSCSATSGSSSPSPSPSSSDPTEMGDEAAAAAGGGVPASASPSRDHEHFKQESNTTQALAAALKAYVTSETQQALQTARECCGGHGYAAVSRLGQLREDHDVFTTFEGDNTVLRQQAALHLLRVYEQNLENHGFLSGAAARVRDAVEYGFMPSNPVDASITEASRLRHPRFVSHCLRWRVLRLTRSLARRFNAKRAELLAERPEMRSGHASFEAWAALVPHACELSDAYAESFCYHAFVDMCAWVKGRDAACGAAFRLLADLYGLQCLLKHMETYRNSEKFSPAKARAIRRTRDALCADSRLLATALVDAFGIPDDVLASPIGLKGGDGLAAYLHSAGFELDPVVPSAAGKL